MKELATKRLIEQHPDKPVTNKKLKGQLNEMHILETAHVDLTGRLAAPELDNEERESMQEELDEMESAMEELDSTMFAGLKKYFDNYDKFKETGEKLAAYNKAARLRKAGGTIDEPPVENTVADPVVDPVAQANQPANDPNVFDKPPVPLNVPVTDPVTEEPKKDKSGNWVTIVLIAGFTLLTFGMARANANNY
jgi:hypothetical protein